MHKRFLFSLIAVLLISGTILPGCTSDRNHGSASVDMADIGAMPTMVQTAPTVVTQAYQFAAVNQDVLQSIPCYCGCGAMGHESNYDCFWREGDAVDEHALGCGICVDIAQDVMRGLEQGRTLQEIRLQIDSDYSRFGPGTDTPPVLADAL